MKYCLTQDNDSHWYVVPVDKLNDWDKYLESYEYASGIVPEYAKVVDGSPSLVSFENFIIE